jgi:hypothetical protein
MAKQLSDAEARMLVNSDFASRPTRESDADDGYQRFADQLNGPDIQKADS